MRYEYIHFVKIKDLPKTSVFSCRTNDSEDELGIVKWYGPWRKYCFMPQGHTVFHSGCLGDIQDFMDTLKKTSRAYRCEVCKGWHLPSKQEIKKEQGE